MFARADVGALPLVLRDRVGHLAFEAASRGGVHVIPWALIWSSRGGRKPPPLGTLRRDHQRCKCRSCCSEQPRTPASDRASSRLCLTDPFSRWHGRLARRKQAFSYNARARRPCHRSVKQSLGWAEANRPTGTRRAGIAGLPSRRHRCREGKSLMHRAKEHA